MLSFFQKIRSFQKIVIPIKFEIENQQGDGESVFAVHPPSATLGQPVYLMVKDKQLIDYDHQLTKTFEFDVGCF